ncbi:hypothetical protein ACFE04_018722 [Oxalis oulophora]
MEDFNTLSSDCFVLSCCCQCLILQILVFVLITLPLKLVRKGIKYVKASFRKEDRIFLTGSRFEELESYGVGCVSVEMEECFTERSGLCMHEVEEVLEELSRKGEFVFGSFWGRERSMIGSSCSSSTYEVDFSVVEWEIIEMNAHFSSI